MFKSARWRSEKNKIKAVFKLQFQATQVPQLKKSTLTISLVPEDVGKPTVRLEKAAVQDGTCSWENPIYETVKLIREPKTGKLHEKIYHFIVSTGSSKSGFVGEASIDFADYVAATKPLIVSLPLNTSNSGSFLHVTIQKMQEPADQRYVQENSSLAIPHDRSFENQLSDCNIDGTNYHNFTEDGHLKETSPHKSEQNGSFKASTGSSATLESHRDMNSEQNTKQDLMLKKTTIHQDAASFHSPVRKNSMPQKGTVDAIMTKNSVLRRTNTDWSVDSDSEGSLVDSTNSLEDNLPRERLQEASDDPIEKLKSEIANITRQAEVSELELQTLRRQIVKESKRGQNLSRQIISLKEERDALRTECERLSSLQKFSDAAEVPNQLQLENEESRVLLEEIRRELNYEKDLNSNLRLQLGKTQDSNSELILAVRDLNEMLEQKNREISCLSGKIETRKNVDQKKMSEHNLNEHENQLAVEELAKRQDDSKELDFLRKKITDLKYETDVYRKHMEELQMHIEKLTQDYEVLKQEKHDIYSKLEQNQLQELMKAQNGSSESSATIKELESQVERLEEKLKQQSQKFSESLVSTNECERQVKQLEKQLEKQAQGFEDDLSAITHAKTEQEQRAIQAEEALRKTRWNNAIAAERLQEEFRRLSVEMASKFDENEKLTTKALAEANELRQQKLIPEEMLQKANDELGLIKNQNGVKLQELSNEIDLKEKQIEQLSLELDDKSKQLEYAKKHENEKHEAFSMEIQILRGEIERFTREKDDFSEHAELKVKLRDEMEHMKTSMGETEMLVERWDKEREDLKRNLDSAKMHAEKTQEELMNMRFLKDEKETMVGNLQSELKNLKVQYNELKHSLYKKELEKDNLRTQVLTLQGELQTKEEEITCMEKKLKTTSQRAAGSDENMISRNNKSITIPCDSKEVASLKEKLKLLKEQVKLKEAALETSTNSFLLKERNLSNVIEELESRMEQLKQSQSSFADQFQEEARCAETIIAYVSKFEERKNSLENLVNSEASTLAGISVQNEFSVAPLERKAETCSEKESKVSTFHTSDEHNLTELLMEMALLKERNKSMESELKEMQERYSEISLKFAEVEGERQQLVMTIRNLKNSKKR